MRAKASKGWAPETNLPLIKKPASRLRRPDCLPRYLLNRSQILANIQACFEGGWIEADPLAKSLKVAGLLLGGALKSLSW
jgi:hypothetical protein